MWRKLVRPMITQSPRRGLRTTSSSSNKPKPTEKINREKELFNILMGLGISNIKKDNKVRLILDEYESHGHFLDRSVVLRFATSFRQFKKHHLALKLYEWMDEREKVLSDSDHAIRVDLLSKTEGIASAEKYFESLEQDQKNKKTYGSLLNCYCGQQMVEKATQFFEKMKGLNLITHALPYNNLMNLYMKVGQPEKVPMLFVEMNNDKVAPDKYSYNQLMNMYAARKDISAAERVFENMKKSKVGYDWFTLVNLATMYYGAGMTDKMNFALGKLEKNVPKDPGAFHTLINLYSRTCNTTGVYRAWDICRTIFRKPANSCYLSMHLALSRLGEFDGLEKLFREWELNCSWYDIRIPNVLFESYLKRELIDKASLLYDSVIKRGAQLNTRTYELFTHLCLKRCQIDLALETLDLGASKLKSGGDNWFPHQESINAFLQYFGEAKDAHAASQFGEILKKINRLDAETEEALNRVCQSKHDDSEMYALNTTND